MARNSNSKHTADVDVNLKGVEKTLGGIAKLKAAFSNVAGDLLTPVAMLAQGATKTEAAWGGFKEFWISRVLGPVAMFSGVAAGVITMLRKMGTEWRKMGMDAASVREQTETQFRTLLKSAEAAKARVSMLIDEAAQSPFKQQEYLDAGRAMETLTKGAFAGAEAMGMVADAAAVANIPLEDSSRLIGRLYDALANGRPIGEVAMRMQEVGLMSGRTRSQLEDMIAAGASGSEMWRVAYAELSKFKGASADLGKDLVGLKSTLEDTRDILEGEFSKQFLEGEKASTQAMIDVLNAVKPAAKFMGETLGGLSNAYEKSKAAAIGAVVGNRYFADALAWLTASVALVAVGVKAAVAVLAFKWVAGMLMSARATSTFASTGAAATAMMQRMRAAATALASGQLGLAGASAQAAAQAGRAALGMGALGATTTFAGAAARGATLAVGLLGGALKALLWNPTVIAVMAVAGLVAGLMKLWSTYQAGREALRGYNAATREMLDVADDEIKSIQTRTELYARMQKTLAALAQARQDAAAAAAKGDLEQVAAAEARQRALEKQFAKEQAEGAKARRWREEDEDRERKGRESQESAQVERDQAERLIDQQDPESRARLAQEAAAKFARDKAAAEESRRNEAARREDRVTREKDLQAEMDRSGLGNLQGQAAAAAKAVADFDKANADRRVDLEKGIASAAARGDAQFVAINQMTLDELDRERSRLEAAKVAAAAALDAAVAPIAAKSAGAWEKDFSAADALGRVAMQREAWANRDAQGAAGVVARGVVAKQGLTPEGMDAVDREFLRLKEARDRATSPAEEARVNARAEDAQRAARDGLAEARFAKERALLELREDTLKAGLDLLDKEAEMVRERVAMQRMGPEQARLELEVIAARKKQMEAEVQRALSAARSRVVGDLAGLDAEKATRDGDVESARRDRIFAAAEQERQAVAEAEAENRRLGDAATPDEKAARVAAARRSVQDKFARDEEDRARRAAQAMESAAVARMRSQEEALRFAGKGVQADVLKRRAEAREDSMTRENRDRELRDQDVAAPERERIVRGEQADRDLSRAMEFVKANRGQEIVANVSRRIGAGGGAVGLDVSLRKQDEMIRALKVIAKNTEARDSEFGVGE